MKKKYKALAEANDEITRRNRQLEASITLLLTEKKMWDTSKENQNIIIQKTIENMNSKISFLQEEVQRLFTENNKLREENRVLRGGV